MVWLTLRGETSKEGIKKKKEKKNPNQTKLSHDSFINTIRNPPGGGERMTATE